MTPLAVRSKDNATVKTEFDSYPHPEEFLRDGGLPGIEYIMVHVKNVHKAQTEGFAPLSGVPYFTIKGTPAALLGRGTPSPTGRAGSVRCPLYVDKDLQALVEVLNTVEPTTQPTPKLPLESPSPQTLKVPQPTTQGRRLP